MGSGSTATLPTGWKADKLNPARTLGTYAAALTATSAAASANMSTTAGNGIYNYGSSQTTTDRSLGGLSSGSSSQSVNVYSPALTNAGCSPIPAFDISYDVEKYRNGSNPAGFTIQLYYSTDGTSWTSAGAAFKTSLAADANNNGFATAPGASFPVSGTLSVDVPAGATVYFAWNYSVTSGSTTTNAQGLGVDNIRLQPTGSRTPGITALTPASGYAGTQVTITGTNLCNITAVTFAGTAATSVTASATSVTATVPSVPVGTVPVELTDGTATYPAGTFDVVPVPAYTISTPTLSRPVACPGGTLDVSFQATGSYGAGNTFAVELSDAAGVFAAAPPVIATRSSASTSAQTLTATLPAGLPGGSGYKVRVVASDPSLQSQPSDAFAVSSVSIAPAGAQALLTGSSGTPLTATEITAATTRQWVVASSAGGPYSPLSGQTAASYTPGFASPGTYYVALQSTFACGTLTSNEVPVTVTDPPAPTLTSLAPAYAASGTQVVLTGEAFTPGAAVRFNGTAAAQVQFVSATQLKATVPAGATSGPVTVTTSYGAGSSPAALTVYALDQGLVDDFNRANADAVGNGWTETETVATGAALSAGQLKLSSGTAGREYLVRDVSSRYNPVLGSNDRVLSWTWNMQQSRANPSGFDGTSYGVAYVLAASQADLLTGVGYAVIMGNAGTPDPIKLVRFSRGLSANNVLATVSTSATDFTNKPLTLRVLFDPDANRWILEAGTGTSAFDDPATATYTSLGNAVDDTYATTALPYTGALWNHATTATEYALFDNISVTAPCALAAEPPVGSSVSTADQLTSTSARLSWAAGPGSGRLVVVREGQAPAGVPTDGATYLASGGWGSGAQLAPGEYVVYQGSGTTVSLSNLQPNTSYYYRIYDADGSGCATNYQPVSAATASFTTEPCLLAAAPTQPASQAAASPASSYSLNLSWQRGDGAQRLVVVREGQAPAGLPQDGTSYAANARLGGGAAVAPNEYAVYSGSGAAVTVTGLVPGRTYFAAVYEFNGAGCSTRYLTASPATTQDTPPIPVPGSYRFFRGNLHAHSGYSDGNKDSVSTGASTPYEDFQLARLAQQFDFLGISEHNHAGAGMALPSYAKGLRQADQANQDGTFLALYGMEWGTISGGGHVVIYGYDQLIGWEPGNYDVFVQKGDYTGAQGLFATVAQKPGAVAYLAHPNSADYNNLLNAPLNPAAAQVVTGMAMRSGPAFSTATDYTDPSTSTYEARFKDALRQGYHVGPVMDHDNHNSVFGRTSYARLVVLAQQLTRPDLLEALQQRRFYAADDDNVEVTLTVAGQPMGSQLTLAGAPTLEVSVVDPDGEAVESIALVTGIPGSGTAATTLTTTQGAATLSFTDPIPNGATYYYYAVITQADGDKVWTAPIRYTRSDAGTPLPVTLTGFEAVLQGESQAVLRWATAQETGSAHFVVERSADGRTFREAGRVAAAGTSTSAHSYEWRDALPLQQQRYYRLREVDADGRSHYSAVRTLSPRQREPRQVNLFPVPTAGRVPQLALRGFEGAAVTVRVVNLLGRTVHTQTVAPTRYLTELPLTLPAGLPEGVYQVSVSSGGETHQVRLLLTR